MVVVVLLFSQDTPGDLLAILTWGNATLSLLQTPGDRWKSVGHFDTQTATRADKGSSEIRRVSAYRSEVFTYARA